jgi:L,D-transpeptidase YcbB
MTALDRRTLLQILAGGAASLTSGTVVPSSPARAEDQTVLQALIEQNQREDLDQDFDSASRTITMPKASLPTLSPSSIQATEHAIGRYEAIVAAGGWPQVQPVERLRLGMRHPSVVSLRERFAVVGDLDSHAGSSEIYDSYVEAAVRRFQARHGLSVDGIVREQTFKTLNIPAQVRLGQLKTNLARLRTFGGGFAQRFVMCNIPAAQIEAVENDTVVSRHTAVVGKPDRPSPDIQSKIVEINFNPFWTVPVSIVRRDLIPKMQQEPDYLTKNRIRIFDGRGHELPPQQINWYSEEAVNYQFKQDPAILIPLVQFASTFPTRTRSTCMTRRSRTCSARISAFIPQGACACRMCESWSTGCLLPHPAGRVRKSIRSSNRLNERTRGSRRQSRCFGSMLPPGRQRMASWNSAKISIIAMGSVPLCRTVDQRGAGEIA